MNLEVSQKIDIYILTALENAKPISF